MFLLRESNYISVADSWNIMTGETTDEHPFIYLISELSLLLRNVGSFFWIEKKVCDRDSHISHQLHETRTAENPKALRSTFIPGL